MKHITEGRKEENLKFSADTPPLFSHGINATHHNLAELNHTRRTCANNNQSKNRNSDITSVSKSRILTKITSTLFLKVKFFYCCLIFTNRACQQISILNVEYVQFCRIQQRNSTSFLCKSVREPGNKGVFHDCFHNYFQFIVSDIFRI